MAPQLAVDQQRRLCGGNTSQPLFTILGAFHPPDTANQAHGCLAWTCSHLPLWSLIPRPGPHSTSEGWLAIRASGPATQARAPRGDLSKCYHPSRSADLNYTIKRLSLLVFGSSSSPGLERSSTATRPSSPVLPPLFSPTMAYSLAHSYVGDSFGFDFNWFNGADPSNGYVRYQSSSDAADLGIYEIRGDGSVILGVDSEDTRYPAGDRASGSRARPLITMACSSATSPTCPPRHVDCGQPVSTSSTMSSENES